MGRVFTLAEGYAWLIRPMHFAAGVVAGKPLQMSSIPIVAIGPAGAIDLKTFTVERPAFQFTAQVREGILLGNDRTPAARASEVKHWSLGVHGGAGVIERGDLTAAKERGYRDGLDAALAAGSKILRAGGTSLDAVEAAVRVLEDDPLFNAGKGAVFNAEGRNELDAAIMDGRTRKAGAVAGVTRTKNPISLARAVMEKSDHVMLAGEGADAFSKANGLIQVDPDYFRTEERWKQYLDWQAAQSAAPSSRTPLRPRDRTHLYGTVGAVALDQNGHLAAATSTGGLTGKRWGRIGDSPVVGAGTYAEDGVAAVSATGTGEYFIRTSAARQVRDRLRWQKESIQDATDDTIEDIESLGGDGAIMAMDGGGRVAFSMNSIGMYRGWVSSERAQRTAIYADEGAAP
jgi:beta-aspartyl-peptidase (threonine type)